MYSREIKGKTYTFEPSGGLLNASLVMQDKETDSYWSMITEKALYGPAEGTSLETLPGTVKMTWGEWKVLHPTTRVLSVDGVEHDPSEGYDRYFASEKGFRGLATTDKRLPDKQLIYAFFDQGGAVSVPHQDFIDGGVTALKDGRQLFLFRRDEDSLYRSTVAFLAPVGGSFRFAQGSWYVQHEDQVERWDAKSRRFQGGIELETASGFDTFWYIWSLTHKDSGILAGQRPD